MGLYFNLTLSPAEQHLPQRCPLSCFSLGRVCLEPVSLCLTVSSLFSPPSFYIFVCKTASFPSPLALLGCVAEHVWHGESLHFSHLRVFSLDGNLLSSLWLDWAASLIMLKEHLAAPRVPAGVPHYTNLQQGPCLPAAYG